MNRVETAPRLSRIIKFGVFEVDLDAGELRKSGMRQKLGGQPFEVLRLLLEHPEEIVTREELQRHIWPQDTFVDYDLALKKAVNRIREVLGDSAESPRFIETVPRRGYRFIAPLSSNGHDAAAAARTGPTAAAPRHKLWIAVSVIAGVALLLVLLGVFDVGGLLSRLRATGTPQISSLAVLPLRSLSPDPNQEYFSDALTDELITDLAQISSLKVISHTSTRQYKETKKTLPEIARELNVDGIVEGTVQRSGNRVQIDVQLIHGPADNHLWAQSYEREVSDLFALERDVAESIARQVRAEITGSSLAFAKTQKPVNEIALEAYLQGKSIVTHGEWSGNDNEKRKASIYFQKAIDADPDFELAYIGLAESHDNLFRGSADDALVRKRAAQKVLELDPNSAEAHVILGNLKWGNFEWAAAEEEYRKAAELDPNNVDTHDGLGILLAATGRVDDGLRECQIAQALDPTGEHLPPVLELKGEYDRATAMLLEMARNSPEDGMINYELYRTYAGAGKPKEAVDELEEALRKFGMADIATKVHESYAKSGHSAALRAFAKSWEDLQGKNLLFAPENLAAAYTAAGDTDRAFYWLNQAYEHREMVSHDWGLMILKVDPLLAPLHSDPRFNDLLRRVGLPQ